MKLSIETIIVGGLPNPIGGVTTFLSRLIKAYPQFVLVFLDLYASDNKHIPNNFKGIYRLIPNKFLLIFSLLLIQLKYKGKEIFFNFSSGNSLILFLFLPKFNNKWTLMLHHGHLASRLPKFILKFILGKFDIIYTLNERQAKFYKDINSKCTTLISESSYVPAVLVDIDESEKPPLNNARENKFKIIVGSGFPRALYQHHLLINLIDKNQHAFLFLFLYGDGELKQELLNLKHPRVKIFLDKDEDVFNYYLANADLYVRPTLEDSFGIACADAVEFGTPVIASDVCTRYDGVKVYPVKENNILEADVFEVFQCM